MHPDTPPSRAPSPAEDLFADLVLRVSGGQPDDLEAVCRAHPVLEPELRALHARHYGVKARHRALDLGSLSPVAGGAGGHSAILEELRARGAQLARYRIVGRIGAGGMGTVYEAEDLLLGRKVALKVISDPARSTQLLPLFQREMRIAARISHPGVAGIHDAGVDEQGRAFFTMPLVSGRDLSEVFRRVHEKRDGWTFPRALGVLRQVCDTMAYVHSRGVIHCDLKPSNVRVGGFGEVFVMDWGLAKELAATADATPQPTSEATHARELSLRGHGTPPYVSPEQARGGIATLGSATDIYAIGSMLYELLAGRAPYVSQGETPSSDVLITRLLAGPPQPIQEVSASQPPELLAICNRAMQRDATARYASCLELARDLESFLEGRVVSAYATGAWAEARKWVERNRALAASLGLAAAVVLVAAIVVSRLQSHDQHERLLSSYRNAAEIARQRGAWRQVLENVDLARRAGFSDEIELALLEAEVRLWTGQPKDALDRLSGLVVQDGTSAQRARSHLIQAQALQARVGENDTALEHVRLAMAETLSAADRAFASGLMATTTAESLSRFDEALRYEPLHFAAMSARLTTLFFLGRLDEALEQANILKRCYPDDPNALIMIVLLDQLVHGHYATLPSLEPLQARLSPEAVSRVRVAVESFVFFNTLPSTVAMGRFESLSGEQWAAAIKATATMQSAMNSLEFSPLLDSTQDSWMFAPKVPGIAAAYEALGQVLAVDRSQSAANEVARVTGLDGSPFLESPETCAIVLEDALKSHEEASFYFFHGAAILTSSLRDGETQADKLRRCLPSFERALSTPCILPKIRNMARYLAARCYNDLLVYAKDDTYRERAIAMVRSESVDETSDWEEIRMLGSLAMLCDAQSDGLRLVDAWIKKHPEQLDPRASRINVLRFMGAPGAALEEAEALLREHPENARLRDARDSAAAAVAKLRKQ